LLLDRSQIWGKVAGESYQIEKQLHFAGNTASSFLPFHDVSLTCALGNWLSISKTGGTPLSLDGLEWKILLKWMIEGYTHFRTPPVDSVYSMTSCRFLCVAATSQFANLGRAAVVGSLFGRLLLACRKRHQTLSVLLRGRLREAKDF